MTDPFPGALRAAEKLTCFDNWTSAGSVLRAEKLASPSDVRALAEEKLDGRLLRMKLCKKGDDYKFRLVVVGSAGTVKTVFVDARKPFEK